LSLQKEFEKFIESGWGLALWLGDKRIFRSKKSGVRGLLDFVKKYGKKYEGVIIFDRIVGQAVALLAAYLKAKAVYGALGSELAIKALKKFKIEFYFQKTVSNILNKDQTDLCPFEKLSLDKTPEEFYKSLE